MNEVFNFLSHTLSCIRSWICKILKEILSEAEENKPWRPNSVLNRNYYTKKMRLRSNTVDFNDL
jgi:hypothetical protein